MSAGTRRLLRVIEVLWWGGFVVVLVDLIHGPQLGAWGMLAMFVGLMLSMLLDERERPARR